MFPLPLLNVLNAREFIMRLNKENKRSLDFVFCRYTIHWLGLQHRIEMFRE